MRYPRLSLFLPLPLCSALVITLASAQTAEPEGWTAGAKLRLRTEFLQDSFRLAAPASDQLQLSRLELTAHYDGPTWSIDLELQDGRVWGAEALSPIGTDDINALEPINLKVARHWRWEDEGEFSVSAGRMTLNYGSRRLLARNQFRNTTNAFQGVHSRYVSARTVSQAFYTYPLQRRPGPLDRPALRDNDFQLDRAGRGERFWGLTHDYKAGDGETALSAFVFGSELNERADGPVADRDLITLGARGTWRRGRIDFEAEAAYQWGDSLAGVLADQSAPLDHRAWFTHLHAGYKLQPGLELRASYDLATGDRDPFDGRNERFDRLYGARAFDLGPSGIFGAAIRSNLRSPDLRLLWSMTDQQTWLLTHRWLRLDSARDFLVTAGRRDTSGASGKDVGTQWELRWRLRPPGSGLEVELGGALLQKGRYFSGSNESALLNPRSTEDTRYLFAQVSWSY